MLWLSLKCEIQYLTEQSLTASIVNISSNAALRGYANNSIYAASKAAVNSLTLSAAKELGKKISGLMLFRQELYLLLELKIISNKNQMLKII